MSTYHVWGGHKGTYCKKCNLQRRNSKGSWVYYVLNDPETLSLVAGLCESTSTARRDRELKQPRPSPARILEPKDHERMHISCICRKDLWQWVRDESVKFGSTQSVVLELIIQRAQQSQAITQDDVYAYGRRRK